MQKSVVQKEIYLIALLLYLVLWLINRNYTALFLKSSIGLNYWILDIIIIAPLLFQLFFNNKVGWFFILILLLAHMFWAIIKTYESSDSDFVSYIIIVLLYLIPFTVMYYLYPKKLRK
ncbi:MAG: hypothetical protein ABIN97_11445 [Ginsengibacter sp.]